MRRSTAASPGEGIPRPIIVPKAAVVLELIGLALFIIARTTGAGWDIVLLCGLIAVVMTGSILPAFVLGRVAITVSGTGRRDRRSSASRSSSRSRGRHVKLRVLTFDCDWIRIDGRARGPMLVVPRIDAAS